MKDFCIVELVRRVIFDFARKSKQGHKHYDFAFDILVTCITNQCEIFKFLAKSGRFKHSLNSSIIILV